MSKIEMIDDQFWLKFAKDHVAGALAARDEAAGKIDTFLSWVWTVYTAVFAAGVAFNVIGTDMSTRIIMALPVVLLPLARYVCVAVLLPVETTFATNVIEKIKSDGYATILKRKNSLLNRAKFAAVLSVLSIAAAIFVFRTDILAHETAVTDYYVKATYNSKCDVVRLEGWVGKVKTVKLLLAGTDSTGKTTSVRELDINPRMANGNFDTTLSANNQHVNYRLYASWTDSAKQLHIIKN